MVDAQSSALGLLVWSAPITGFLCNLFLISSYSFTRHSSLKPQFACLNNLFHVFSHNTLCPTYTVKV